MKYGFLLFLIACAAAGCKTSSGDTANNAASGKGTRSSKSHHPLPNGPKIGLVYSEQEEPWMLREVEGAKNAALNNGARLTLYVAPNRTFLRKTFLGACANQMDGLIVACPNPADGEFMKATAKKRQIKLISIENNLKDEHGKSLGVPALTCDFPKAGILASRSMMKMASERTWDLAYSGMIVFVNKDRSVAPGMTDSEIETMFKMGLPRSHVFTVVLDRPDIAAARDAAVPILRRNAAEISNWFLAGSNDLAVVGGVRAAEDVGLGLKRTIGLGIGGDGALYDLQRPRPSGVIGSIVLPADAMGSKAEYEMFDWISNKLFPVNYSPLEGALLDHNNVRRLKAQNHLVEYSQ